MPKLWRHSSSKRKRRWRGTSKWQWEQMAIQVRAKLGKCDVGSQVKEVFQIVHSDSLWQGLPVNQDVEWSLPIVTQLDECCLMH